MSNWEKVGGGGEHSFICKYATASRLKAWCCSSSTNILLQKTKVNF